MDRKCTSPKRDASRARARTTRSRKGVCTYNGCLSTPCEARSQYGVFGFRSCSSVVQHLVAEKKKRKQRYSVICHAATHKASGRRRSKSVRAPEVKNAVFPSLKQPQPASCLKGSRETVLGSDCFNAAPTPFFRSPHPVKLVPIALPPPDIIYMLSFFFFAIAPINTHTRPKPLTRSVTIEPLCPSHIYISSWSH